MKRLTCKKFNNILRTSSHVRISYIIPRDMESQPHDK